MIVDSLVQPPDYRPIVPWTARETFAFVQRNADTWKRLVLTAARIIETLLVHLGI
jgi:hypothetical protein